MREMLYGSLAMLAVASACHATSIRTVTLEKLVAEADVVARLSIRAGDADGFEGVVYRATVLEGLKGANDGDTIYIGPFVSYGIGSEYVMFLQDSGNVVGPPRSPEGQGGALAFDGEAPLLQVMYAGYGALDVTYSCAIPDCGDGVVVNTQQVVLPRGLRKYRREGPCAEFDTAVVRRAELLKRFRRQVRRLERPGRR